MKTTVLGNQSWSWSVYNTFDGAIQKFTGDPKIGDEPASNRNGGDNPYSNNGRFTKVTVSGGTARVTTVYDLRYTKSGGVEYSKTPAKTP